MQPIPRAALLLFWLTAGVAAQQAPARRQPPPGTVHAVFVKGNKLYPSEGIVAESGLKSGERVDAPTIERARARLQATELFNDVAYQYRTSGAHAPLYDITFEVSENTQTFPMRFERLGSTPAAISSCLKEHVPLYSDRIPGTEGVLRRYAAAVEGCLAPAKGSEKVKATISNDDPKELAVLFSPETPAPTISQVFVSGNQAVDTGTILRAVNQIAVGVPLSDTRLKMILEGTIRPLYAAKGYAAVSFPKVDTEPAKGNLGVIVRVQIKDGPMFKFGAIRFRGRGLDEDEVRSTIPFRTGQPYNAEKVDTYRLDIARKMKRRGLLDTSVSADTQTDDAKRAVNVTYNVTPGATYTFRKLDVQGLDVTTEPAIQKLWGEKPGAPFNPEYPDFFLKRVGEQGIFDNLAGTRSDYTADSSTHDVTVHLYFKGGKSPAEKGREKSAEKEKQQSGGGSSPY